MTFSVDPKRCRLGGGNLARPESSLPAGLSKADLAAVVVVVVVAGVDVPARVWLNWP